MGLEEIPFHRSIPMVVYIAQNLELHGTIKDPGMISRAQGKVHRHPLTLETLFLGSLRAILPNLEFTWILSQSRFLEIHG
jgi:hypothetical protein